MAMRGITLALALLAAAGARSATSSNVVFIGGSTISTTCSNWYSDANSVYNGGCLTYAGLPGTFSALMPGAVTAAALAPFDTAILVLPTYGMGCSSASLSAQAKADLISFVGNGHKLMIYDSECPPVDYSWLPYPFTTSNPGAMGEVGTLNIVENNTLGSADPGDTDHYIDAAYLGQSIDAVGDMNVMVTKDSHWCVAMSGTNYLGVTGAVVTYANVPAGADHGLIIYNGLDQDYMPDAQWYSPNGLEKMFRLALLQEFDPSALPCAVTVTGIKLAPDGVQRNVGETHEVTAKLSDLLNHPRAGITVNFTVDSGPNAGLTATGVSDVNGQVTFAYLGVVAGVDQITASFTDTLGEHTATVSVTWVQTGAEAGGPYNVDEGNWIKVKCTNAGVAGTLQYAWDLDGSFQFLSGGAEVIFNAKSLDGPATKTIACRITSSTGEVAYDYATVNVRNVAPKGQLVTQAGSTLQGRTFAVSFASVYEPSGLDRLALQFRFDCNDGNGFGAWSTNNVQHCVARTNGAQQVKGQIKDLAGDLTEATTSIWVTNAAPQVTVVAPAQLQGFYKGQPIYVTASFVDPGVLDTHSCAVYVGGAWVAGTVTEANGAGTCVAWGYFMTTGTKHLTVRVTDNWFGIGTASVDVLVQ